MVVLLSHAVSKKHGKLITFLRTFMKSRPTKQKLKQRGILKERVFGCDLGEHLLNSGHDGKKQPAPGFFLCWEFVRVIVAVQGLCWGTNVWHKSVAERETEANEKQTLCFDVGSVVVRCGSTEGGCNSCRWVFNLFTSSNKYFFSRYISFICMSASVINEQAC